MTTPNLYEYSLAKLAQYQGNWPDIARSTGVSYSWICKLAQGKIPSPGLQRMERLVAHFNAMDAQLKVGK